MAIQFDLIIPPIIVGFIILLIFRISSFMMSTSIDNRLGYEMQNFADITIEVIQNELRTAVCYDIGEPNSYIAFTSTQGGNIQIFQENRLLKVIRDFPVADTIANASRLDSLAFEADSTENSLLRIEVYTSSIAEQEAGPDDGTRVKAYAEKQVFLRNNAYTDNPCSS